MKKISICLDVGGTFVKGAIFSNEFENKYTDVHYYPANSKSSKNEILDNFKYIFLDLLDPFDVSEWTVEKIAIAFPGPFDYKNGISLIKNLNKFDDLYGLNLADEIRTILGDNEQLSKSEIFFENDGVAFAYGENSYSKVDKGAYFTIGTGVGSTFIENGSKVIDKYKIPKSGMIYNEKFQKSIIDDYVSARGLEKLISHKYFEKISGAELFTQAEEGSKDALSVFNQFGVTIGKAINPYITDFQPKEICFGGQISKSFKFFGEALKDTLKYESGVLRVSEDTTLRILEGLFIINKKKEK